MEHFFESMSKGAPLRKVRLFTTDMPQAYVESTLRCPWNALRYVRQEEKDAGRGLEVLTQLAASKLPQRYEGMSLEKELQRLLPLTFGNRQLGSGPCKVPIDVTITLLRPAIVEKVRHVLKRWSAHLDLVDWSKWVPTENENFRDPPLIPLNSELPTAAAPYRQCGRCSVGGDAIPRCCDRYCGSSILR